MVGLGVMGANLGRNIESRGFRVAGYDLDPAKVAAFAAGARRTDTTMGVDQPDALMAALERPRRILMMVPAGAPVDGVIAHLVPHVEPGDILIDGGNSFFKDTDRRAKALEEKGILFVGDRRVGRRGRRAARTGHHAGWLARARGRPSRRSSRPSPPRPTMASRAWATWAAAARGTT